MKKITIGGVVTVLIGGLIYLGVGTKTVKVPCLIPRFDTTFETKSFCDTIKVFYDSIYYVTVRPNWRPYKKKYTKHTDSLRIDNCRDSSVMVVTPTSYWGMCDSVIKEDTVIVTPKDTMAFGLWIQGGDIKTTQKIELLKSIGGTVGRVDLVLINYNGGILPELKEMSDAGLTSDIILSWNNKQGGKFVRDTADFRRRLGIFLQANKQYKFFITTEDEVITDGFFSDDFAYYINELKICVDESHKYGIEASNSGDHIVYAGILAAGGNTHNGNEGDLQYLLEAYKNIPMSFLTLHNGMEQTPEDLKSALDYIKKVSGFTRYAMNAHVFKGTDPKAVGTMAALYKQNNFILFMPFDGNGTAKASSFHVQKSITKTDWGTALHDLIILK